MSCAYGALQHKINALTLNTFWNVYAQFWWFLTINNNNPSRGRRKCKKIINQLNEKKNCSFSRIVRGKIRGTFTNKIKNAITVRLEKRHWIEKNKIRGWYGSKIHTARLVRNIKHTASQETSVRVVKVKWRKQKQILMIKLNKIILYYNSTKGSVLICVHNSPWAMKSGTNELIRDKAGTNRRRKNSYLV